MCVWGPPHTLLPPLQQQHRGRELMVLHRVGSWNMLFYRGLLPSTGGWNLDTHRFRYTEESIELFWAKMWRSGLTVQGTSVGRTVDVRDYTRLSLVKWIMRTEFQAPKNRPPSVQDKFCGVPELVNRCNCTYFSTDTRIGEWMALYLFQYIRDCPCLSAQKQYTAYSVKEMVIGAPPYS